MSTIFILRSEDDSQLAFNIKDFLESEGIEVQTDNHNESNIITAIFTKSNAAFLQKEIQNIINEGNGHKIILLKADNCKISKRLKIGAEIDLQVDFKTGMNNLLAAIQAYERESLNDSPLADRISRITDKLQNKFANNLTKVTRQLAKFDKNLHPELQKHIAELIDIQTALENKYLTLSVFGRIKAGKSTLINALTGEDISPVNMKRTTSCPLLIYHKKGQGMSGSAQFFYNDGSDERKPLDTLSDWMRGASETELEKIDKVIINTENPILGYDEKLRLLDTAGIGSRVKQDGTSTFKEIERSVAAIFVYKYEDPETRDYMEILQKLKARHIRLFAVCNITPNYEFAAQWNPTELEELLNQTEKELKVYGAECLRINLFTAQMGKKNQDQKQLESSNISSLEAKLKDYLLSPGIEILRERVCDSIASTNHLDNDAKDNISALQDEYNKVEQDIEEIRSENKTVSGFIADFEESLSTRKKSLAMPKSALTVGGSIGAAAGLAGSISLGAGISLPWILVPAAIIGAFGHTWGQKFRDAKYKEAEESLDKLKTEFKTLNIIKKNVKKELIKKISTDADNELILQQVNEFKENVRQSCESEIEKLMRKPAYIKFKDCLLIKDKSEEFAKVFKRISDEIEDSLNEIKNIN